MARDLRVPLLFAAPRGWEIGDPDAMGVPEAGFACRSPESDRGHHPTIHVADVFAPHDGLGDVARRGVAALLHFGDVEVLARTPEEASFRQSLALTTPIGGDLRDLVQDQVYREFVDPGTRWRAVVLFALTAVPSTRERATEVFGGFLGTVRLGERAWLWP